MKTLLAVSFASYFLIGALAMATETIYHNCILEHLGGAKLDMTVDLMKKSCEEIYGFSQGSRRTYNECLLENLKGVVNANAAIEIENACNRIHL